MSTDSPVFDFPTAWKVMEATAPEHHHEKCSYRVANRGLLCDCAALQSATAAWRAAHDDAEISDPCDECGDMRAQLSAAEAEVDRLRAEVDALTQQLGDQEARDRHIQASALDWAARHLLVSGAESILLAWAAEVRAGTRTITTTQETP